MKTLLLSGVLGDDGTLDLHIPFTVDLPASAVEVGTGEEAVEVELLDESRLVLIHALVNAAVMCSPPAGAVTPPEGAVTPAPRWLVSGAVPRPDGTTGLRLRWRGVVIHEAVAPVASPVVRLSWAPPASGIVSGEQTVTWQASHPDDVALHVIVATEHRDGSHQAVASLLAPVGVSPVLSVDIDASRLPEDTVALVVTASDGFHQTSDRSSTFSVSGAGGS